MQDLAAVRAIVSCAPHFQLFQTVWVYSTDDYGNGCFDKGVVAGYRLPESDLESREWWYIIWFDVYPRIPRLAPLADWAPESALILVELPVPEI